MYQDAFKNMHCLIGFKQRPCIASLGLSKKLSRTFSLKVCDLKLSYVSQLCDIKNRIFKVGI